MMGMSGISGLAAVLAVMAAGTSGTIRVGESVYGTADAAEELTVRVDLPGVVEVVLDPLEDDLDLEVALSDSSRRSSSSRRGTAEERVFISVLRPGDIRISITPRGDGGDYILSTLSWGRTRPVLYHSIPVIVEPAVPPTAITIDASAGAGAGNALMGDAEGASPGGGDDKGAEPPMAEDTAAGASLGDASAGDASAGDASVGDASVGDAAGKVDSAAGTTASSEEARIDLPPRLEEIWGGETGVRAARIPFGETVFSEVDGLAEFRIYVPNYLSFEVSVSPVEGSIDMAVRSEDGRSGGASASPGSMMERVSILDPPSQWFRVRVRGRGTFSLETHALE